MRIGESTGPVAWELLVLVFTCGVVPLWLGLQAMGLMGRPVP